MTTKLTKNGLFFVFDEKIGANKYKRCGACICLLEAISEMVLGVWLWASSPKGFWVVSGSGKRES
jgi:hypothetical protein